MAGKLRVEYTDRTPRDPNDVKAYCDGRQAAKDGHLNTENPHQVNSDHYLAWAVGHISWTANPAGKPRDCCAIPYGGGYV
jgi:hypothetical protein